MTAYETRAANEDERDRLGLLRCYCPGDCNCRHQGSPWNRPNLCGCRQHELYRPFVYRPYDKQGDIEPFDVQAEWEERA